jgi:ubiquinone/menaquinone biosynthesis C-methylase UbiE
MYRRKPNWIAQGYFWLTDRLYNELAWAYDPVSWVVSLGHWDSWRKQVLNHLVGTRMLEIGFGTGEMLLAMRHMNMDAIGLECSPAMQRITSRKLRRQGLWAPQVRGIVQQMPFTNESFDTILATFPAGYIFDPATWREVARLLRKPATLPDVPGGRFVVVGACGPYRGKSRSPLTRIIYGLPLDDLLVHFQELAEPVNLKLNVVRSKDTQFQLPIMIAEGKKEEK